jgi:hypothetical protein
LDIKCQANLLITRCFARPDKLVLINFFNLIGIVLRIFQVLESMTQNTLNYRLSGTQSKRSRTINFIDVGTKPIKRQYLRLIWNIPAKVRFSKLGGTLLKLRT